MKRCVAIMALLLSLACTRDTDMAGTYAGSYSGLSGAVRGHGAQRRWKRQMGNRR